MNKQIALLIFFLSLLISRSYAAEKLLLAVDIIRHGDRTPVIDIPTSPFEWKQELGSLTPTGEKQLRELGQLLRNEYVNQKSLLPESYRDGILYVRSTDTERTQKSARFFLEGLYPDSSRNHEKIAVHVIKRNLDDLLLVKPKADISSKEKMSAFEKNYWYEKIKPIETKLNLWREITGMKLNDLDEISDLADHLWIRRLHDIPFPQGLNSPMAQEIISLSDTWMLDYYKQPEAYFETGDRLISNIKIIFEKAAQKQSKLKYVLYVGHDSTLLSILYRMGIQVDTLPGFASRIHFSLIEENNRFYFKTTYNGNTVLPAQCKHTLCPIESF